MKTPKFWGRSESQPPDQPDDAGPAAELPKIQNALREIDAEKQNIKAKKAKLMEEETRLACEALLGKEDVASELAAIAAEVQALDQRSAYIDRVRPQLEIRLKVAEDAEYRRTQKRRWKETRAKVTEFKEVARKIKLTVTELKSLSDSLAKVGREAFLAAPKKDTEYHESPIRDRVLETELRRCMYKAEFRWAVRASNQTPYETPDFEKQIADICAWLLKCEDPETHTDFTREYPEIKPDEDQANV